MNYKDFFKREAVAAKLKDAPTGDVDEKELAMGIEDEMKDHTVDRNAAETITRQHLKTNPYYYSDMKKCGIGEDMEMGGEEGIPKFPDGSLAAPRGKGVVSISKIVCPGSALSTGKSASGDLSGYKSVSSANDVEPITASGKVSPGVASKSVGGPVSPGEGQKQGGPNTKGCIADTPKNSRIEAGTADATALFENKKASRDFVKKVIHEVMDEMSNECSSYKVGGRSYKVQKDDQARAAQYEPEVTENRFASMNPDNPDAQTPEGQESMICSRCNGSGEGMSDGTKCLDCKGSGDVRGWGKPKTLPSRRDPDYDPRDQGIDEAKPKNREKWGQPLPDGQGNRMSKEEFDDLMHYVKGTGTSKYFTGTPTTPYNPPKKVKEAAPPGFGPDKEHADIYNKVKKQYPGNDAAAYATMWKIHKKITEGSLVQENGKWVQKTVEETVNMKMGPSYKVVSPTQAQCSDDDQARTVQYDPQMTEGRCEDYPCCGHEAGDCPSHDKQGREIWTCVGCGKKLPHNSPSSLCQRCRSRIGSDDSSDFGDMDESGGAAVQHKSLRTANDAPQIPKNRHKGDIDENSESDEEKLTHLKDKRKRLSQSFKNASGEGDSRNTHLAQRDNDYEIEKLEKKLGKK